jgi:hypothetical protein
VKQRSPGLVPPILALVVGACSPDAVSNPIAPPVAAHSVSLAVRGDALGALRAAVEDAQIRILPSFADESANRRIGGTLAELRAALAADDAAILAAALGTGRAVLRAERTTLTDPGTVAELDALTVLFSALDEAVPASLQVPSEVN